MNEITALLNQWQLDEHEVRDRMYRAPSPRERWHAVWLLVRGWSAAQMAAQTADALERDPHTIGEWLANFRQAGPRGLVFEQTGGSPPPWLQTSRPS